MNKLTTFLLNLETLQYSKVPMIALVYNLIQSIFCVTILKVPSGITFYLWNPYTKENPFIFRVVHLNQTKCYDLLFFLTAALLSYNSHIIKLTHQFTFMHCINIQRIQSLSIFLSLVILINVAYFLANYSLHSRLHLRKVLEAELYP